MDDEIHRLHGALLDLVGIINSPQQDDSLIREAGVSLDRALFPLLVRIEQRGPLSVGRLAELAGRDHSTVSRQVAKLESLGLIARAAAQGDRRTNAAVVTDQGRSVCAALDVARRRRVEAVLAGWSPRDRRDLARLLRRVADDALRVSAAGYREVVRGQGAHKR